MTACTVPLHKQYKKQHLLHFKMNGCKGAKMATKNGDQAKSCYVIV